MSTLHTYDGKPARRLRHSSEGDGEAFQCRCVRVSLDDPRLGMELIYNWWVDAQVCNGAVQYGYPSVVAE